MSPRIGSLVFIAIAMMSFPVQAQLFPNAFWNKSRQPNAVSCPGGNCPTTANVLPGHWTYPGTISNHLERDHGVSTSGLTRQEQLNLHDSIHEGTTGLPIAPVHIVTSAPAGPPQVTTYYYPSQTVKYGNCTGSTVSGGSTGGSTGSFSGGSSGSDSVGVQRVGRREFKRQLLAQAKLLIQPGVTDPSQLERGKITQDQYDALSLAIKFPGVAAKIEAALTETAIENGLATTQAIDWEKLADFIERMIPIILKLIDLFSFNDSSGSGYAAYDYQLAA